jgi:hypothetical protein
MFQETIVTIHELCFIVHDTYHIYVSVAADQPQAEHYNTNRKPQVVTHYVHYVKPYQGAITKYELSILLYLKAFKISKKTATCGNWGNSNRNFQKYLLNLFL